jgi:aspartyl-tRNA(Asn)/glutamyl-tRNA(Gln) amidotransferase subunit B
LPTVYAVSLTQSIEVAAYFEKVLEALGSDNAKLAANWILGELAGALNGAGLDIGAAPVSSNQLAGLLLRICDNTISGKMAKGVFDAMWAGEGDADAIIDKRGLKQISDAGELEKIVDAVLAANPKSVGEYRAGKEKAFNALVGQAMKATKGKGNPAQINEILKKKLAG